MNPYVLVLVHRYGQATAEALALLVVGDKAGALALLRSMIEQIEAIPEDAGDDNLPDVAP